MSKKSIILCLIALAAMAAVMAFALFFLFSGPEQIKISSGEYKSMAVSSNKVLLAVPSDASIILSCKHSGDLIQLLTDSTKIYDGIFASDGGFRKFVESLPVSDLKSLGNAPAVISLHYIAGLAPLMIVGLGKSSGESDPATHSLISAAKSAGLQYKLLDCSESVPSPLKGNSLLLISSSEALLTASQRHVESGSSVLDRDGFPRIAASADGKCNVFVANSSAVKAFPTYLSKEHSSRLSGFFSHLAEWTSFSIVSEEEGLFSLSGRMVADEDPAYYVNVLRNTPAGEIEALEVLPANSISAVGIATTDAAALSSHHKRFLDATKHLDAYKAAESRFKTTHGMSSQLWASSLDLREIVKVTFTAGGGIASALLLRLGKENSDILLKDSGFGSMKEARHKVFPYAYPGVVGQLFGKAFSLDDEGYCSVVDGWLFVGSEEAVGYLAENDNPQLKLKALLGASALKGMSSFSYFSPGEAPSFTESAFRPSMAASILRSSEGMAHESFLVAADGEQSRLICRINRSAAVANLALAQLDTAVVIPKGPFKVKNCGTGRTNIFAQNSNLYLTLSEEDGKGIWGVQFGETICGYVEMVDFYKNGKIQFLFAAGSKLYLIDRLGRFVNGFPVDLGKPVLLGPKVYDFNKDLNYCALVLHKDSSVELYTLDGSRYGLWKGIRAPEAVKSLPELMEFKGARYWVVRTAARTLVYGFYGGEPIAGASGRTMIRPDASLELEGDGFSAECTDGKRRNFKLE